MRGRGPLFFFALTAASLVAPTWAARVAPTILDCEIGDEAAEFFAIAQAVRSPRVNVVGVTTVSDPTGTHAEIVREFLAILGRRDIQVIPGADPAPPVVKAAGGDLEPATPTGAAAFFIQKSKEHPADLQIVFLGGLSNLSQAIVADASFTDRLRRLILSNVRIRGETAEIEALAEPAAQRLFSSNLPIALVDRNSASGCMLDKDLFRRVAEARTPATDRLTRISAAGVAEVQPDPVVPAPHTLAVAYSNDSQAVMMKPTELSFSDGHPHSRSAFRQKRLCLLSKSASTEEQLSTMVDRVTDGLLDFGVYFTHYLLELRNFRKETRDAVEEKFKSLEEPLNLPEEMQEDERTNRKVLSYLETRILAMEGIEEPPVQRAKAHLATAYLRVAGIGWWFPDEFYWQWRCNGSIGGSLDVETGVSNPYGAPLKNLEITGKLGDQSQTETVDSTTAEFAVKLSLLKVPEGPPFPESLTLFQRFEIAGFTHSASLELPVLIRGAEEENPIGVDRDD